MTPSRWPNDLHVAGLEPGGVEAFSPLAPGAARPWLEGLEDPRRIAVGATRLWASSGPVGLALVKLHETTDVGSLGWIFVRPAYRGMGIGAALVAAAEAEALRRGCPRLRAIYRYPAEGPDRVFGDFLRRIGWELMEPAFLMCEGTPAVLEAPWTKLALPRGFESVPWEEIRPDERQELAHREVATENGPRIGGFPSPLAHTRTIEPRASYWIRYGGRLIGWVTALRVDENTIEVDSMSADPEFRTTGQLIPLVSLALRSACEAGYRRAVFEVRATNTPMVRFVRRRLVPHGVLVREYSKAERDLEPVTPRPALWTPDEVVAARQELLVRAASDVRFKRRCLEDPAGAVRDVSGLDLPADAAPFRFVDGPEGLALAQRDRSVSRAIDEDEMEAAINPAAMNALWSTRGRSDLPK